MKITAKAQVDLQGIRSMRSFRGARSVEAGRKLADSIAERVGLEFSLETHLGSSGPTPWPKRKAFGRKQPSAVPGGARLRNSLVSRSHPEHVRNVTPDEVVFGTKVPYARYFRGRQLGPVTFEGHRIKPKKKSARGGTGPQSWAMWWFLFLEYGVALSAERLRKGLNLPPRPFLTPSPWLAEEGKKIYLEALFNA